jgi:hypothetical protein
MYPQGDIMSDIFSSNAKVNVDVYYSAERNAAGHLKITIIDDEKAEKLRASDDPKVKDRVKLLRTEWRPQSWQAANELITKATVYNFQTKSQEVDWNKFRDAKIKSLMVDWDAKDEKGEKIPCVEPNINKLNAAIALALIDKYDTITSVDREEMGKS